MHATRRRASHIFPLGLTLIGAYLMLPSQAATIIGSATFASSLSGSTINVTTMSDVVDWGYLDHGSINPFAAATTYNFTALTGANYHATSGIGAVTVTNNTVGTVAAQSSVASNTFTYSGGNSPASGTDTSTGGQFGSMASTENDAVTFDFNNLGLGQHTITLYVGHKITSGNDTRVFNMDYSWFASDGNVTGSVQSDDLGNTGTLPTILSTFQITVNNTVDANADLKLDWDSVSGGAGNAIIAGYTVQTVAVPEPRAALLGGFGLLLLLKRRR